MKRRIKTKVNSRKVHLALATLGPGWDPDAWGGDAWHDDGTGMDWSNGHKQEKQARPVQARSLGCCCPARQEDGQGLASNLVSRTEPGL